MTLQNLKVKMLEKKFNDKLTSSPTGNGPSSLLCIPRCFDEKVAKYEQC